MCKNIDTYLPSKKEEKYNTDIYDNIEFYVLDGEISQEKKEQI